MINDVDFRNAVLTGSTFWFAELFNVDFRDADLRGVDFLGGPAYISPSAHWSQLKLQGVLIDGSTRMSGEMMEVWRLANANGNP